MDCISYYATVLFTFYLPRIVVWRVNQIHLEKRQWRKASCYAFNIMYGSLPEGMGKGEYMEDAVQEALPEGARGGKSEFQKVTTSKGGSHVWCC